MKVISLFPDQTEANRILSYCKKSFLTEDGSMITLEIDENSTSIHAKAIETLKETLKPLFLGKSHEITLPIAKAFCEVFPVNPGMVIFDAHPDADATYRTEDLLLGLIHKNLIKKENIILVGTRAWKPAEYKFIKKNNIKYFSMHEIAAEGLQEISESIMVVAKEFNALYISIDMDVLDPAFAPGTNCPEPGGLTTRELLFFLKRLKKMHNLRAWDLSEIDSKNDPGGKTATVGAKIIAELC